MLRALIAGFLFACSLLHAQALPTETERLTATAKLWITVKYFHPSLASGNFDWDKPLLDAIPKIRSAQALAAYSDAIHALLSALPVPPSANEKAGRRTWIHNGFPPESGAPSHFYSAFLTRPGGAADVAVIPMGGFSVSVPLSEPAHNAAAPAPPAEHLYPEPYPSTELRILAAFKIWGVIHHFFAYRDLMDEDWDDLLPLYLPRLIEAKDAREYNLAVAEWLVHLADSQSEAHSATLTDYFGAAGVPLRLGLIEKHAVVTAILDPSASAAGIQIGDIVKSVDGETLVDRFQRYAHYVQASTTQSLGDRIVGIMLNGAEGSQAQLSLEDRKGVRKQITLPRHTAYASKPGPQRTGDALRLLPGNIGYADLEKLTLADVSPLFEKFKQTTGIVFDLRTATQTVAAAIAAHLTSQTELGAAIVTGPITLRPGLREGDTISSSASSFQVEALPEPALPKYSGRTIALIDARTIGSGEHAGLLFEAAAKTEFLGTPSAGADSELSDFSVPGGVTIVFSGSDIRHANGGKLQRLGLQPNISAAPTLSGIRDGKDEVLEKALSALTPKPTAHPATRAM